MEAAREVHPLKSIGCFIKKPITTEQLIKRITALCTAVENGEGSLDKEASHDDLMDAFRMSLMFWH